MKEAPGAVSRAPTGSGVTPPDDGRSTSLVGSLAEVPSASRRLRALASLSGSLTDALDPEEAARLVERQALSALGASSAVVVTLGAFPGTPADPSSDGHTPRPPATLAVVHAIALHPSLIAAIDGISLEAPMPLAEVARTGEAVFLGSRDELRRYPEWAAGMIEAGAHAAAIVPVWANGELRGVLGLVWTSPRPFDEDERAYVVTLGVMCAQAIMRSYLRAAEQRARKGAERANQVKTDFIATISHELRTPMTAVIGYTDLLDEAIDGPVNAAQKERLNRVRASGKHMLALIEELLGFARLEAGQEVMRLASVSSAKLVADSLVLIQPIADKKGLRVHIVEPEDPVELYTDARKVRQVLANLLANAVKFSDGGAITLTVHDGDGDGAGGHDVVDFDVTDDGVGIPQADQEQVFDPFWQSEGTELRSGGTGLGLFVARQLARLLGGDLVVAYSAPGEGSTFRFSVPTRAAEMAARSPLDIQ